jgi:hypothetical protein
MKVKRTSTRLLGVQVNFPGLAKAISFQEVSFIVNMETMFSSVLFQIGDVAGHVDNSHRGPFSDGEVTC